MTNETPSTQIETLPTPATTPTPTPAPVETPVEAKDEELEMKAQVVVDKAAEKADEVAKAETTKKQKKARKAKAKAKAKSTATAKKAAPKKAAAKKAEPTSGQSGPVIENLTAEDLNPNEVKVMKLAMKGEGPKTIVELAKAFTGKNKKTANSWTRNSLRRLVRGGFLAKVERGAYRATGKGRRRMAA